jgi:hypothetical protein
MKTKTNQNEYTELFNSDYKKFLADKKTKTKPIKKTKTKILSIVTALIISAFTFSACTDASNPIESTTLDKPIKATIDDEKEIAKQLCIYVEQDIISNGTFNLETFAPPRTINGFSWKTLDVNSDRIKDFYSSDRSFPNVWSNGSEVEAYIVHFPTRYSIIYNLATKEFSEVVYNY